MKIQLILLVTTFTCFISVTAQDLIPYRDIDKWGYANNKGEIVIAPQFEEAGEFRNQELTWVKKEGKYGYISREGKEEIKFKYDEASYFGNKIAVVKKGDKELWIDKKGNTIKERYAVCGGSISVYSYFVKYTENDKIGIFISEIEERENGKIYSKRDTLSAIWEEFKENHAEYAGVKKDGKWGVINIKGELVTDYQFDILEIGSSWNQSQGNHFFRIKQNNKYGFLNNKGKLVIAPKYHKAEFFIHGIAKVWINEDYWGYIDEEGNEYFTYPKL